MPAVEQDGNVMVPVQENQLFLVNDNEKRVQEFTVKGVCVVVSYRSSGESG
jgi:hypothetical protein